MYGKFSLFLDSGMIVVKTQKKKIEEKENYKADNILVVEKKIREKKQWSETLIIIDWLFVRILIRKFVHFFFMVFRYLPT